MWRSDYNSDGDGIVLILDFAEILCAKTLPSTLKKKKKVAGAHLLRRDSGGVPIVDARDRVCHDANTVIARAQVRREP